ncbi:hypothetical protein H5410_002843 [Solanum commersonii]|uniref:Uncharacterized protein n=1 Tax=Solanum commersonii TaxID=4109 RepID=A0A9J6B321_SOLCO|nr:hypothetical protein H5410_002843 [Solanum commersonii]
MRVSFGLDIVLKEWCIKVYDSMSSSKTNRKLTVEIQKLSTMLPKDYERFVAAYAEFLSDGLQVPSYGIISQSLRTRYASLL